MKNCHDILVFLAAAVMGNDDSDAKRHPCTGCLKDNLIQHHHWCKQGTVCPCQHRQRDDDDHFDQTLHQAAHGAAGRKTRYLFLSFTHCL